MFNNVSGKANKAALPTAVLATQGVLAAALYMLSQQEGTHSSVNHLASADAVACFSCAVVLAVTGQKNFNSAGYLQHSWKYWTGWGAGLTSLAVGAAAVYSAGKEGQELTTSATGIASAVTGLTAGYFFKEEGDAAVRGELPSRRGDSLLGAERGDGTDPAPRPPAYNGR